MTSGLRMRWFRHVGLAIAVAALPAVLVAADRTRDRRDSATPSETVEMFAGMEKGDIEVQLIPKDSTQCNVLIKNKTDKPLKFGTLSLEPGTYTLNTQPGDKQWQLIVGKLGKPGQWGSRAAGEAGWRTAGGRPPVAGPLHPADAG